MRKQDRDILAAMINAADNGGAIGTVIYSPGRDYGTRAENTRPSFKQYNPASVGFKTYKTVTAPVERLISAGYVTDVEGEGRQQLHVTEAGRAALAPAGPKVKPLTPAMQRLTVALEMFGHIDPIRDFGRLAYGQGRIGTNTVVALIDRDIVRPRHPRFRIYFATTTPEQVWDEAHAEDARRDAEYAAYLINSTNWAQCTPDEGGDDCHTRQTRGGETILITQDGFRFWQVTVPGQAMGMSAHGTWAEVRAAADRFERELAYGQALIERDERDQKARTAAIMDALHAEAHDENVRWHEARVRELDHAEALAYVERQQHIAQAGVAHVRNNCPALKVGGCMKCAAPATVRAAQGDDSAYPFIAYCYHPRSCPACQERGYTCTKHLTGTPGHESCRGPRTPAERITGISDRAAAALADVAELRDRFGEFTHVGLLLDRIEAALREGQR